jgi:hypothetical protein
MTVKIGIGTKNKLMMAEFIAVVVKEGAGMYQKSIKRSKACKRKRKRG